MGGGPSRDHAPSKDAARRACTSCGNLLSRYNSDTRCQACVRTEGNEQAAPQALVSIDAVTEQSDVGASGATWGYGQEADVTPLRRVRREFGWKIPRLIAALRHYAPQAGIALGSEKSLKTTISRHENGHITPGVEWRRLYRLVETPVDGRVDVDYVQWIRESGRQFVALDGVHGGNDVLPLALRAFRMAHAKLGSAHMSARIRRDAESALGELGQIAAWLAYDSDRQSISRSLINEARLMSRLSGDRDAELFALDHMAMQSLHLHRPHEAMQIIGDMDRGETLPPRVTALFDVRRGRAFGQYGEKSRALEALGKARSSILDGITARDPRWTWWVDEAELLWHEAMIYVDLGDWKRAVPLFQQAADLRKQIRQAGGIRYRRAGYNDAVHFLNSLIHVGAWQDAEQVILGEVIPNVAEVNSMRTTKLLDHVIDDIKRSRNVATSTLVDLADGLRRSQKTG